MSSTGLDDARDPTRLLEKYVALCNVVLAENEQRFLFRQARRVNRAIWGKTRFRTIVYEHDPAQPLGEYILQFDPDARPDGDPLPLSIATPSEAATHGVAFSWKVPLRYLEDVVKVRPEWYRQHPLRLDWQWLSERAGDEVRRRPGVVIVTLAAAAFLAGLALSRRIGARGRSRRAG